LGNRDWPNYKALSSAEKAAASCIGSPDTGFAGVAGTACGFSWLSGTFDSLIGVGPQMNALQSIMYTLVKKASVAVTRKTGGSSKSNPSGGKTNTDVDITKPEFAEITPKDKVGAGIITCLVIAGIIGGTTFAVI
jgi:mannan endo-1,6-alpha-mannosidase